VTVLPLNVPIVGKITSTQTFIPISILVTMDLANLDVLGTLIFLLAELVLESVSSLKPIIPMECAVQEELVPAERVCQLALILELEVELD